MLNVQVKNMTSSNGNKVPNQFIITSEVEGVKMETFQSYETIIAKRTNKGFILDAKALNYSTTTLKYLKQFLDTRKSKKQLQNDINSGLYIIEDLNT